MSGSGKEVFKACRAESVGDGLCFLKNQVFAQFIFRFIFKRMVMRQRI